MIVVLRIPGYLDMKFSILDVAELRQKFEEDKQKVARMKAARKFKPY